MERAGDRRGGSSLTLDRRGLLAALAAGAAAAIATPLSARPAAWRATQALLDGYVAKGLVPGAVAGIVTPGRFRPTWLMAGRTEFEGGSPVSPTTLWRIYSMTKPITSIAVMQQVAAGRLRIDTPIAEILPEFRAMRVLVDPEKGLESRPATRPILVRHLLTHTAGFTYTIRGDGPLEKAYRKAGVLPMSAGLLLQPGDTPAPDLQTWARRLAELPLLAEPGGAWHYSVSIDLAGALLERLTGKTLDTVFAAQLFDRLGMADTGFSLNAARQRRLAGLYAWVDSATMKPSQRALLVDSAAQTQWSRPPIMLSGGAGLVSSAENYARFAQMMLNEGMFEGQVLLPRNMARLAMSNLMEKGVWFQGAHGNGAGGRAILSENEADPEAWRVGTWGWGGAASTQFHVDPIRGHAVVLMLQSVANPAGPNERDLNRALSADSAPA